MLRIPVVARAAKLINDDAKLLEQKHAYWNLKNWDRS